MKQKSVYWVPRVNALVILSALCMVCSAVVRTVWAHGETAISRPTFWLQILLPIAANLFFALTALMDCRERLYRTAIPVWMGCVFFAVKAQGFPSRLHTVLCLLLYALVAVLYTATVTGRVPSQVPLWFLFGLPMAYHIIIEDRQKIGWPLHDWLPEISVLLCMAAMLLLSLTMKKRPVEKGAYIRRFGDRADGRRLRMLSPIFAVSPYIMKTRNTSQNFIQDHIEITNIERYIIEKRRAGMKSFGILHVLLASYVRACARYPGLNRFIAGQKIYCRDREIQINMTIKKEMSTDSPEIIADVITYGRIVCVFSMGVFFESIWTKILQANGDMKTPMIAQIVGAAVNIIFDPLLIFGLLGFPRLGIAGSAIATVAGQIMAALVVMKRGMRRPPARKLYRSRIFTIFRLGVPNILMQSAYTFYIFGLNMILSGFSDQAVTALGIYYKWQTIFFIPLGAMQTCIVPIVSFNYAARRVPRCRQTMKTAILFGMALMFIGTLCFEFIPAPMLRVFTSDELVVSIGTVGLRTIGVSFIPLVTSLIFPVFFQAIGSALKSSALTVLRTVVLFVPLGFIFSRFGLNYFWLTFPVTEVVTTFVGFIFYRQFLNRPYITKGSP